MTIDAPVSLAAQQAGLCEGLPRSRRLARRCFGARRLALFSSRRCPLARCSTDSRRGRQPARPTRAPCSLCSNLRALAASLVAPRDAYLAARGRAGGLGRGSRGHCPAGSLDGQDGQGNHGAGGACGAGPAPWVLRHALAPRPRDSGGSPSNAYTDYPYFLFKITTNVKNFESDLSRWSRCCWNTDPERGSEELDKKGKK